MQQTKPQNQPNQRITIISAKLPDGRIIETGINSDTNQPDFIIFQKGMINRVKSVKVGGGQVLVPISSKNDLFRNRLVSFPSAASSYESVEQLVESIRNFIHRYVDLSEDFKLLATYYVLLTWIYDRFNEIPYLRKVGDYGSGKTRFLKTLGSICYKGVFASGGTSTAAIFHIIDKFKGTLIIDEADFIFSDEKSAVAKILNNGNAAGFPILRVSGDKNGKFTPISYDVFCPKIIASRNNYSDQALESRFITENLQPKKLRKDIPTTLPDSFDKEALELRNQLLSYRFENIHRVKKYVFPEESGIEGRIKQIFGPLLSVVPIEDDLDLIHRIAEQYSQELQNDRGDQVEAQILAIIKKLSEQNNILSIGNITAKFSKEYSNYYYKRITAKWIGYLVRKKLNLKTYKSNGVFVIDPECHHLLRSLYERYLV